MSTSDPYGSWRNRRFDDEHPAWPSDHAYGQLTNSAPAEPSTGVGIMYMELKIPAPLPCRHDPARGGLQRCSIILEISSLALGPKSIPVYVSPWVTRPQAY